MIILKLNIPSKFVLHYAILTVYKMLKTLTKADSLIKTDFGKPSLRLTRMMSPLNSLENHNVIYFVNLASILTF